MRPSNQGHKISLAHSDTGSRDTASDRLLTVTEAADYLRLTPSALYSQRYRSENPGALGVRVGRKIIYRKTDIDSYLDRLQREAQTGSAL